MLSRFKKNKNGSSDTANSDDAAKKNKKLLGKFLDFITSSIWSIPIASFIESQSVVFDRQQMETEIYYEIHKEYAQLIDTLIECFCEDVGTTSAELVEAIRLVNQKDISEKYKVALEPLLAAQNFNVFVPMMMRKNVELQLQALQMIEFMCGLIPSVLQLEDGETLKNMKKLTPEETERYVLISVLRHSKDEYDATQKGTDELETVARNSRIQREQLEQEIQREEILLQKALTEGAKNQPASTQTNSVAAVMASHFTVDNGTSTDDIGISLIEKPVTTSSTSTATMTSTDEKEKEARPKSAKRAGSASRKNSTVLEEGKTTAQRKYSRAGLEDLVGVQKTEAEEASRPPSRKASKASEETTVEAKEASRPPSRKTTKSSEETVAEPKEASRPSSRKTSRPESATRKASNHEPRAKTPSSKSNDDRPTTRRSSVDKVAPKRNDSIPRERRSSMSTKDKGEEKKPPKPMGPLKSNKYEGDVILGRPESPGMNHGPRRKNLNDVNAQLVDPSRLSSSDIRNRAQYLREQRDKLLQLKNEERIKQMNDIQRNTVERPRTAQAARGILDKKETDVIRKEISDKLKTEILTLN